MAALVPWVPDVFLACGGNFRCWPKAEAMSGETGNRARKVSGTQGATLETSSVQWGFTVAVTYTSLSEV